jgi:diguanylate cyclase (GGDEF)-like protein
MTLTALPSIAALVSRGGTEALAGAVLALLTASIAMFALQNYAYLQTAAQAEHDLRLLARTDALTGLTNRIELERLLALACARVSAAPDERLAVLYLDLDDFKTVNDEHGHITGDVLLKRVAQIMKAGVAPSATVARIGGDEFIVLLPGADEVSARRIADQLVNAIGQDHRLPCGTVVRIGCSVGISLAPAQGTDPELLLARADQALDASKHRGKGQTGVWRVQK